MHPTAHLSVHVEFIGLRKNFVFDDEFMARSGPQVRKRPLCKVFLVTTQFIQVSVDGRETLMVNAVFIVLYVCEVLVHFYLLPI